MPELEQPPELDTVAARSSQSSGYSLAMLFYLTTIAAIFASASRYAAQSPMLNLNTFAIGTLLYGFIALIAGVIIGYRQTHRLSGMITGAVISILCTLLSVWISLIVSSDHLAFAMTICLGSFAVVFLVLLIDRFKL